LLHTCLPLAVCPAAPQDVPRLPLPLVKICDFGYSKAENKSAAKSKVRQLVHVQTQRSSGSSNSST
jgi:hypothetical protein